MYGLTKKQKVDFLLKKVEEFNLTAYDIGKKTGLSVSGVDKILNKIVKNPQEKTLNIILEFLEEKVLGTSLEENIHILKEPNEEYKINTQDKLNELNNCLAEKNT